MPTAKATTKSSEDGKVDTSTSGSNTQASATSAGWISKSTTKTDENGNTLVEKIFGRQGSASDKDDEADDDSGSGSSWTLLGSKSNSSSKKTKGSDEDEDDAARADASTGKVHHGAAKASSGKASAGIVDGKAVATAG